MENMYPPPGGFREWPTEQFGPKGVQDQAEPDRPGGPGRAYRQAGGTQRRARLGVAVAAAAVLLCGGAVAGAVLAGGASPAAGQSPASAGPTGQAALLNTMLNSASSSASAGTAFATAAPAGSPAATRCRTAVRRLRAEGRRRAALAELRACRRHLLRLRVRVRVLAGIHGQFTFETKSGPRTLAFERGVVQSVSSAAVVVRAQDGTTWTWDLVSTTVVRQHARRAATSALSAGQHVFVAGPVIDHASDARLIVIRGSGRAATSSTSS